MTFVAARDWTATDSAGRAVLWTAVAAGLAARVLAIVVTGSLGTPIVDEQHYTRLASHVLGGDGLAWSPTEPTSIRPPLYPAFVAGIWLFTGEGTLQPVRLLQAVIGLLTTGLVCQLGRRTFNPRVGRYAAAAFWLYPSLAFFNFTLLTETLFTFLLVAFVLLAVIAVQSTRPAAAAACGVALGLGALTRSVLWPLPLVLCPLLFVLVSGPLRRRLAVPALVLAGYAIVVVPWAVRNTQLQGVVTIVDTMGGMNLRMGNYEHTPEDRMWAAVDLTGEKNWGYQITREFPGQTLTEGQKDKWAQAKAVAYMLDNPVTTARRMAIKLADFWGIEREFIAGVRQGIYQPPAWMAWSIAALIALSCTAAATLGIAGFWLAAPEWRVHLLLLLPVVAIMGVHTIVFGHSRYHVPLVPILLLYAFALLTGTTRVNWRQPGLALVGAALSVAALLGIWIRQVFFVDAGRLGALVG